MRSRLFELVKQKELKEHRSISIAELSKETKLARNTITVWLSDEPIERIHVHAAVALAHYLGVEWHELCETVEVAESEN